MFQDYYVPVLDHVPSSLDHFSESVNFYWEVVKNGNW